MRVPYLGRMFVLWRPLDMLAGDEGEAEIRILIATDGERVSENTLEEREMFMPLFNTQVTHILLLSFQINHNQTLIDCA